MSKHTPGPWVARNSGPHWNNNKISNWTIHYGDNEEHIVDHVYEEADARLIEQAPRLLEALEPFAALLQSHNDTNEHGNPVPDNQPVFAINGATITIGDLRKARAAIAAATGEQP